MEFISFVHVVQNADPLFNMHNIQGQGKSTAPISANVNGLSAFCLLVTR